jgi:hypothetical protein
LDYSQLKEIRNARPLVAVQPQGVVTHANLVATFIFARSEDDRAASWRSRDKSCGRVRDVVLTKNTLLSDRRGRRVTNRQPTGKVHCVQMRPGAVEAHYQPEIVGVLVQHGTKIFDLTQCLAPLS